MFDRRETGRQANGRSSIYLGRDGRWHGRVSVGLRPDGRPDRRHVTAKTQAAVTKKVRDLERARDARTLPDAGSRLLLRDWLDEWLRASALRVRPSTLNGYEVDIRRHIVPAIGMNRLDRLRPENIEHLYRTLRDHGLNVGSIHHVRRTLSKALHDAVRRGRLARNPVPDAHTPQYVPPQIEPLTANEARRILIAARAEPNGAAFVLALSLGLRRGEVLALRWRYVDLDGGRMRVSGSLSRRKWRHGCGNPALCAAPFHHIRSGCPGHPHARYPEGCPRLCRSDCTNHAQRCPRRRDGGLVIDETKTTGSRRPLPLPAPLRRVLREHRTAQDAARERAANLWVDNDLVFTGARGQPVDPNRHSEHWQHFLKRLGIRPARLHDARHTTATLLLVQGVDQRVVMDLFGWTSSAMANRYQHVVSELQTQAADRVADLLFGQDDPQPDPGGDEDA
jgi:integrase